MIHDYELFQMKEGKSVEEMFFQFSKIVYDPKSIGRSLKSIEQVRKNLRSLPMTWKPKVIALECLDLGKISYDELHGDLIAFENTHLNRRVQEEKKKSVAFKATLVEYENEKEEEE